MQEEKAVQNTLHIEYHGLPLSAILPIPKTPSPDGKLPQLWIYGALWDPITLPMSLENVDRLVAEGYVQTSASMSALESQLYQTARLVIDEEQQKLQLWYKPDTEGRDPLPVVLAFSIENTPEPQNIPMLNPFPVPQFGEYAFVEEQDETLVSYFIMNLPLAVRSRWSMLGELLRLISVPCLWPPFTLRHQIASDEQKFQNTLHSLAIQEKLAIEPTKTQLFVTQVALKAAHMHVADIRSALQKENLSYLWQQVQRMTRDLARDYYEHHKRQLQHMPPQQLETPTEAQSALAATHTEVISVSSDQVLELPVETEFSKSLVSATSMQQPLPIKGAATEPPRKRRGRRPHTPPLPLIAREEERITVRSDILNYAIIKQLRNKETYQLYESQGIAESKITLAKEKGSLLITIRPQEGEGFDTILAALNTLGDECADTYIALLAIAIDKNGTQHIRMPFSIDPDDVLELRGIKKSHGSYTPLQRAMVIGHLKTLSQAHVLAIMPGKPATLGKGKRGDQGTVLKAEGALIDLLSWKIGEYKTITGEEVWEKRGIAIGPWVTMIPELNAQTATMLRQVLAYAAKNERYQKRLGTYLTVMFRSNAHRRGSVFECSMTALLEGAGIIPDLDHPARFREAVEFALEILKQDNVIGDYTRIYDATPEGQEREERIQEQARHWWDAYSTQSWRFSPPDYAKEQYKRLAKVHEKPA